MKRFIVLIFDNRSGGWNVKMEPKAAYTFREGAYDHDVTNIKEVQKKAVELFKSDYWFIDPKNYVVAAYKVEDDPRDDDKMHARFPGMYQVE